MTRTILITALEEGTGKTAVGLALALLARERGLSVGYMKPKGTRLQSAVGKTLDEDPLLARELLDLDEEIHDLEPIVYSPTFIDEAIAGREHPDELRERIVTQFETLAADRDLMIVEGGGELTTGGIVNLSDPEVASLLDASVLLVAHYRDPADTDDLLAAADVVGDRMLGVLFNAVPDAAFDRLDGDVVPFLEGRTIPVLGILPLMQELAGVTVGELATELGAEVLTREAPTDAYVERFVVGAMGGDSALQHFRRTRDAAVVTGGDRADIHTAALEAPGVKCLLLTGGLKPPGTVLGRAEKNGVPVLLVRSDTLSVVDRAEDVIRSGRTRDEKTVRTMRRLLTEHADVDTVLGRGRNGTGDEP